MCKLTARDCMAVYRRTSLKDSPQISEAVHQLSAQDQAKAPRFSLVTAFCDTLGSSSTCLVHMAARQSNLRARPCKWKEGF